MIRFALYIILILALTAELHSQFSGSDTSGFVGSKIPVQIQYHGVLENDKDYSFESDLLISNPTVFYPLDILSAENTIINHYTFQRKTDSTYHLSINLTIENDFIQEETFCSLKGELLAGNDSITKLYFSNVILGDSAQSDFSVNVKSTSASGFMNYVRFARITGYYPNPLRIGETLHLDYYIDKKSKIKFYIYDLRTKAKLIEDLGIVGIGLHSFEFILDGSFSAGLYYLMLETNSGFVYKPLVIIK
ncbi:MAG: hypothetical protein V1779_12520 [bacterium]